MSLRKSKVIVEPNFVELKPMTAAKYVPNYLVEKRGNDYHIHRELNNGERIYYDTTRLISHNKRLYLKNIKIINTFQDAYCYVEHIWGNTVTFNMIPLYGNKF